MIKRFFESNEDILANLDQTDYRPSDYELRKLFNIFNTKFFQNSLPSCKLFNYSRLNSDQLGCFYFNPTVARGRINSIKVIDEGTLNEIGIAINSNVAFTKRQLCNTLIHEMIHLYQFIEHPSSVFIDGGHETFFLEKADHITAISEFTITPTCDQQLGDRNVNDMYSIITENPILCLLYKVIDGKEQRFGVASIPFSFIDNISYIILHSGKYSRVEFYEPKNEKLLNKIDSIFGTKKESAILKALKVMNDPDSVSTRDFTCASWYDIDRMFEFFNDTRFIVGITKDFKQTNKPFSESLKLESSYNDEEDIEELLSQSGDYKLIIKDIEQVNENEFDVKAMLV